MRERRRKKEIIASQPRKPVFRKSIEVTLSGFLNDVDIHSE